MHICVLELDKQVLSGIHSWYHIVAFAYQVKGPVLFSRLLIGFSLFLCSLVVFADEQVKFLPAPQWVQSVAAPTSSKQSPVNGQRYLLIDRQLNLDAQQVSRYFRNVIEISTTEGLEQASQLSFEFNPGF